jgi:hypothetical protein
MTKPKPKPIAGAGHLRALREAAAKEFELPIADWRVRRHASLALAYQQLEALQEAGHDIDISRLLQIDGAMQAIVAALPPPEHRITLTYKGPADRYACPACGVVNEWPEVVRTAKEERARALERLAKEDLERGRLAAEAAAKFIEPAPVKPRKKTSADCHPGSEEHLRLTLKERREEAARGGSGSLGWSGTSPFGDTSRASSYHQQAPAIDPHPYRRNGYARKPHE